MKIIDAHCHIHNPGWVKHRSNEDFLIEQFNCVSSEKEILANMAEANVDKTIIFPMPSIEVNLTAANLYTLYVSKMYPDKFIPFTIVDQRPEAWAGIGARGFKEHTFGQRIQRDEYGNNIFSQKFKTAYQFMEKERMPLLLHAGVNRIERLRDDILKDTPDLKVILAHLGADFHKTNNHVPEKGQVVDTLKQLNSFNSVVYDFAAILDIELIKSAIEIVGVDKLIFGSDFPCEKPAEALDRLNALPLNHEQKEKILYRNILKILGESL